MINKKNLDPSKTKVDKRPQKNILISYIAYVTFKNRSYITINSVDPLYFVIIKINMQIEESNGKRPLTPVSTNENKGTLKIYEELWNKIRDLIKSITIDSDNYDEKHMKIKFNSDDDLPLKKTVKLQNMVIVVRSVFHEDDKYYPQFFLNECFYKL